MIGYDNMRRCIASLVLIVCVLGCTGLFSQPPVETVTYHLVVKAGEDVTSETWTSLQRTLQARFVHRGFDDAVVRIADTRVSVQVNRVEGRSVPTRLFEVGALTIHRVDELQSKGSDRVLRQALETAKIDRSEPPETIWAELRRANLLTEDRWAFFSETSDGRAVMLVVQSSPFIHSELFESVNAELNEAGCEIKARWTERLGSVVKDPRMRRNRDRVALMLDSDLLELRTPVELFQLEHHLVLRPPPLQPVREEGGRRVWESRASPENWCRDLSAVLSSGPLITPLELDEIQVISP